jgi:hypothetical protein
MLTARPCNALPFLLGCLRRVDLLGKIADEVFGGHNCLGITTEFGFVVL